MTEELLLETLDRLDAEGRRYWLDGGWGIDALVGEETRHHRDADLSVPLDELDATIATLRQAGFELALDERPTRLVLRREDGLEVDLHPLRFDERGDGWQLGADFDGGDARYPREDFTTGRIAGREVHCISAKLQVTHHIGYEPSATDYHDMRLLRDRLGETLPAEWDARLAEGSP